MRRDPRSGERRGVASGLGVGQVAIATGDVFLEVHFADAFAVALDFDLFAELLAEFRAAADGGDDERGQRAIRGLQGNGGEPGQAHPPGADHEGVLDPVEFDFVDVLIDDAIGDADALGGQLKDLAADDEKPPHHVAERHQHPDPRRGENHSRHGDADEQDEAGGERTEIEPLRGAAFPKRGFV